MTTEQKQLSDWLTEIATPESWVSDKDKQNWACSPSTMDRGNEKWSVVTDGRMLLGIRCDLGFKPLAAEGIKRFTPQLLEFEALPEIRRCAMSDLRRWSDGLECHYRCSQCNGSKKTTCFECGTHGVECQNCDELGREYTECEDGMICGHLIDVRLIWRVTKHAPLIDVSLASSGLVVAIRGDGFTAGVCYLKDDVVGDCAANAFESTLARAGVIGGGDG